MVSYIPITLIPKLLHPDHLFPYLNHKRFQFYYFPGFHFEGICTAFAIGVGRQRVFVQFNPVISRGQEGGKFPVVIGDDVLY